MLRLALYKDTPVIVRSLSNEFANVILYNRQLKVDRKDLCLPKRGRGKLLPIPFYNRREAFIKKHAKHNGRLKVKVYSGETLELGQYSLHWYVVRTTNYSYNNIRKIINRYGLRNLDYEFDKRITSKEV